MAIDIGPGATDRDDSGACFNRTLIDRNNAANATGTVSTFEIWMDGNGAVTAATWTNNGGDDHTCTDFESVGAVVAGAKRTFSGLDIDVTSGDFLGFYSDDGSVSIAWDVGSGTVFKTGDQTEAGQVTFDEFDYTSTMSVYGTGTEAAAGWAHDLLGIANASIGKVNGIAIASIGKIDGV